MALVKYSLPLENKVATLIRNLDAFNQDKHTTDQHEIQKLIHATNIEKSIANDMALEIDRLDGMLPKTDKEFEAIRIKYKPRATVEEIDEDLPC
jgi:hypothetical protein